MYSHYCRIREAEANAMGVLPMMCEWRSQSRAWVCDWPLPCLLIIHPTSFSVACCDVIAKDTQDGTVPLPFRVQYVWKSVWWQHGFLQRSVDWFVTSSFHGSSCHFCGRLARFIVIELKDPGPVNKTYSQTALTCQVRDESSLPYIHEGIQGLGYLWGQLLLLSSTAGTAQPPLLQDSCHTTGVPEYSRIALKHCSVCVRVCVDREDKLIH